MMSTPAQLTFGQSSAEPGVPQGAAAGSQSAVPKAGAKNALVLILAVAFVVLLIGIVVVIILTRK